MKQIKLTFLLTVLMSMVGAKSFAHDIGVKNADGKTIYYNYINNSTELEVTYRGGYYDSYSNEYTGNVVIPSEVTYNNKTYKVTSIGNYAFRDCSGLTSVTIPNNVTSIGWDAFYGTAWYNNQPDGLVYAGKVAYKYKGTMPSNTSVSIKDGTLGIGYEAFYGCSGLTSVTIPNSVTNIGDYAFMDCSRLTSVTIPNSVTSIGSDAFKYCSNQMIVNVPVTDYSAFCNNKVIGLIASEINKPVCLIDKDGNEIKEYLIPEDVTSIGDYAFRYCSGLTSVTIGTGVLSIGSDCFQNAKPEKVIWLTNTPPSGYSNAEGTVNYVANEQYTSLSNKTVYPFLSSMFDVDGVKYVPVSPSERTCDAIDCNYDETAENVNIGNTVSYKGVSMTVKQVKPYVCYGNNFIKNVQLDFSGDVGRYAFSGCTALQTATVSNQGYIGIDAFSGCTALQTATVSNQGDIGSYSFSGCTALQTVTVSNLGNIGSYSFSGCTALQTATVSNQGYIGDYAFSGSTALQTANINNKGTIGSYAFENSGVKELTIGANVTAISKYAFQNCKSLATATLGDNIASIGNYAFNGCKMLKSITIPDATTSVGSYAFQDCSSMETVQMGSGLTAINDYTFSGCSSLKDVKIGANVKTINQYAFTSCSALPSITIPQAVTEIGNYVFYECKALKTVTLEDKADDAGLTLGSNGSSPLFADCPLESVYIGRNISYSTSSSYGYSPFYRNTSLQSVVITDRETEISENEFYGCTNLKNVTIGEGVTTIGKWAFSGCSSLASFAFGSSVKTIGQEAFSDCTAMTHLVSKATTPPTCGTQALDDINKWNCTLSVPEGCNSVYQQANQWKDFFFIDNDISGINSLAINKNLSVKSRYTLNGQQVSKPQRGLNIVRMSDGTTKKVVVK